MQKIKKLLAIGLGFLILMSSSSFVACGENSKHVHKYIETVVPSTCTAKGYTEHKCDCGDIYKDNEQELISHVGNINALHVKWTSAKNSKVLFWNMQIILRFLLLGQIIRRKYIPMIIMKLLCLLSMTCLVLQPIQYFYHIALLIKNGHG